MSRRILIIEDDPSTQELYSFWLEQAGLVCIRRSDAATALHDLPTIEPATICLDLGLPDRPGLEVLAELKRCCPQVPVIVITSDDDARSGVAALKSGAHDYLVKPVDPEAFAAAISVALQRHDLEVEVRDLRSRLTSETRVHGVIGQSSAMQRLATQIGTILDADVPVLLHGEAGTGKELVARTIHENSRRSRGPFVVIDCGAIESEMREFQLFGRRRALLAGNDGAGHGFFADAHRGTVLLDEVGALGLEAQATLLWVIEEDEAARQVRGEREHTPDVRLISSTHHDLQAMVRQGTFREDLYFRLATYPVALPPLRSRVGDIPMLAGHFLRRDAGSLGVAVPEVTEEALRVLANHRWPGNVRELRNAVQFALLASGGEPIEAMHLPATLGAASGQGPGVDDDPELVQLRDPMTGGLRRFEAIEREILRKSHALSGSTPQPAERPAGQ